MLNDFSFHELRHTFATRLFENIITSKTVKSLLGNSKISTTLNIYSCYERYKR
ncbi:tyrosine-type recombinase/integrase [Clostridium perfringens]|uniref:tyrosine-type recombinase/integrase n=1 Tax=Clostridium perfringens TaxID=1502 RepID=UPI0034E0711B